MTNEEKIQEFRKKSITELNEILNDPNYTESDIVLIHTIWYSARNLPQNLID